MKQAKHLAFDLLNRDQRLIFAKLISALNESGVTWDCYFDECTGMICVDIGEGY